MTLEDINRLERVYLGIIVKILVAYDMGEKEYDAQKYRTLCMARDTLNTDKTDILQANRHIGFVQALLWREDVCTMPQMRQYWIEQIEEYDPQENYLKIDLTDAVKEKMKSMLNEQIEESGYYLTDFEFADLYGTGKNFQLIYHHKHVEDVSASMEFEVNEKGDEIVKAEHFEIEED